MAEIFAQLKPARENALGTPSLSKKDALAKVTRYHAAFTPKMMERSLKQVIPDKVERDKIIAELLQSGDVTCIGQHKDQAVYATQEAIDLEKTMTANAKVMAKTSSHTIGETAIHQAIFNLNNTLSQEIGGKASLSAQQTQALRHMASDKQLSLVVGVAGAGKTTIMAGAKEALEAL